MTNNGKVLIGLISSCAVSFEVNIALEQIIAKAPLHPNSDKVYGMVKLAQKESKLCQDWLKSTPLFARIPTG